MNQYESYWDAHALNVGHRLAVTDLSPGHYEVHHRAVLDNIAPDKVKCLLDYGCGAGLMIPIVHERWPGVVYKGADVSGELLKFCRSMYPDLTFYKLPENPPQGQFDFIICHSIFTHIFIDDAEILLDQLYLLLTDDGRASVSILTITDQDYAGNIPRMDHSKAYFQRLLEKHGFSVVAKYDRYQMYYGIEK